MFINFVELYNDVVYDLLDDSNGHKRFVHLLYHSSRLFRPLFLYEDGRQGTYVHGVTEVEVKSANEALRLYYKGQKRRRVGATALNKDSSRSHGIFSIRIVRTGYDATYDEVIMVCSPECNSSCF